MYWGNVLLIAQSIDPEICFDIEAVLTSSSFLASNGVVLAAEKKQKSLLYDESTVSKVNAMIWPLLNYYLVCIGRLGLYLNRKI